MIGPPTPLGLNRCSFPTTTTPLLPLLLLLQPRLFVPINRINFVVTVDIQRMLFPTTIIQLPTNPPNRLLAHSVVAVHVQKSLGKLSELILPYRSCIDMLPCLLCHRRCWSPIPGRATKTTTTATIAPLLHSTSPIVSTSEPSRPNSRSGHVAGRY